MNRKDILINFIEGKKGRSPLRNIINGCYIYKGRTLEIINNTLYNYNTILAIKKDDIIYLNMIKYSNTTSHIQTLLKRLITEKKYKLIEIDDYKKINDIIKNDGIIL